MPSRSFPPLDPNPRNQLSIACKFRKYCERSRENLHTKKKRKGASFYASFFCHKLGSKQTEIPSHLQLPVQYLTICRCNFCLFLPFIIYMLCVLPGISSLLISTLPVHSPAFSKKTSPTFFLCQLRLTLVPVQPRGIKQVTLPDAGSRFGCPRNMDWLKKTTTTKTTTTKKKKTPKT